jgi:hypothetical protein
MQKIFFVVALCIAGAAAFAPSTLPLRLKGSALHGNVHLARCRKVTPQKTMALQAAPAASAALGAMQVHFATSQILVRFLNDVIGLSMIDATYSVMRISIWCPRGKARIVFVTYNCTSRLQIFSMISERLTSYM